MDGEVASPVERIDSRPGACSFGPGAVADFLAELVAEDREELFVEAVPVVPLVVPRVVPLVVLPDDFVELFADAGDFFAAAMEGTYPATVAL